MASLSTRSEGWAQHRPSHPATAAVLAGRCHAEGAGDAPVGRCSAAVVAQAQVHGAEPDPARRGEAAAGREGRAAVVVGCTAERRDPPPAPRAMGRAAAAEESQRRGRRAKRTAERKHLRQRGRLRPIRRTATARPAQLTAMPRLHRPLGTQTRRVQISSWNSRPGRPRQHHGKAVKGTRVPGPPLTRSLVTPLPYWRAYSAPGVPRLLATSRPIPPPHRAVVATGAGHARR